jgi:PPK2 family polyphosphate:nucleotide phosphotransferase
MISDRWRVAPGTKVQLSSRDPASTEGAPGGKAETVATFGGLLDRISGLQERMWAEHQQSLLVVLQAIDTGGKDGTIKQVFEGVNPTGVRVASFKQPTAEELSHDFLWRVHRQVPAAGEIVIFNRSHYEDVIVVRVHDLVPKAVWRARYRLIRQFEQSLSAARTRIVKVFLHISKDEQARRLQARLDDPDKHWKLAPADIAERRFWDDYQAAFTDAIEKTTTERQPWFVIPANHKWYRNWAVSHIVLDALTGMDPHFPPGQNLDGVVVE